MFKFSGFLHLSLLDWDHQTRSNGQDDATIFEHLNILSPENKLLFSRKQLFSRFSYFISLQSTPL